MTNALDHCVEYLAEATCLGLFMVSAAAFATCLLQHPASPWMLTSSGALARVPMGIAMGVTAVGLIHSPGLPPGAHMNPVVTLTFWRLGKIASADAAFYVAAQFLGGSGYRAGHVDTARLPGTARSTTSRRPGGHRRRLRR